MGRISCGVREVVPFGRDCGSNRLTLCAQLFFPQSSPFPFPYVKFPQKFPRGLPLPPKFPLGEGGT